MSSVEKVLLVLASGTRSRLDQQDQARVRGHGYRPAYKVAIQINIMNTRTEGDRVLAAWVGIDDTYSVGIVAPIDILALIHGIAGVADLSIVLVFPGINPIVLHSYDVDLAKMLFPHEVRSQGPLHIEPVDSREIMDDKARFAL